jgi:hypothetical protein
MLDDLDRRWHGQFDNLARVVNAVAAQLVVAIRTALKRMLECLGGWLTSPSLVMARVAFLAGWLGFRVRWLVRFDEGRRIVALLFEFSNPCKRRSQLVLELGDQRAEFCILGSQLGDLVFKRHGHEYSIL